MIHFSNRNWSDNFLLKIWPILVFQNIIFGLARRKRTVNSCEGLCRKQLTRKQSFPYWTRNPILENRYGSFFEQKNDRIIFLTKNGPIIFFFKKRIHIGFPKLFCVQRFRLSTATFQLSKHCQTSNIIARLWWCWTCIKSYEFTSDQQRKMLQFRNVKNKRPHGSTVDSSPCSAYTEFVGVRPQLIC